MAEIVDQEETFIRYTKGVAKTFVDLYLMEEFKKEGTIAGKSPYGKGSDQKKALVLESEEEITAEADNQATLQVAQRLRELGDKIDEQLKAELDKAFKELYQQQSIWDVGYSQFQGVCRGILVRCQGALTTGWDQVSVVYTVVGRLVGELRVHQGERGGLRETQMQGFAGNYMVDSGIQEWVEQQGGFDAIIQGVINSSTPSKVDLTQNKESEV